VAGLCAAYRLTQRGHEPHVYERWPGLGGQAATLDVGDGHLIERYYHHLFTSDRHIAELYDELGMPDELEWRPSSVGMFSAGEAHPFTAPLDLLRFSPMSLPARIRMGLAVVWLQRRHPSADPFHDMTARAWVERTMGQQAWDKVWGPLLHGKYGARADDIAMAWLWGKLTTRRQIKGAEARKELLGYPRHSFEALYARLRAEIEGAGGRVTIDRPAARVARAHGGAGAPAFEVVAGAPDSFRRGHDPREYEPAGEPERYDSVIATVPSDVFERVLDPALAAEVGEEYLGLVHGTEYQEALCLVLELDRRFGRFYWLNVADSRLPFIGLIEHTNFIEPERYGGRRFLYVANYLDHGDPLLSLSAEELLAEYLPGLRLVNPEFDPDWVLRSWLFREPAAQPIVPTGYVHRIPPLRTPVDGLVLANTTQIYPEDRGTNYSVRLGGDAVTALLGE
jgi:protoporphyrinogen oxidase